MNKKTLLVLSAFFFSLFIALVSSQATDQDRNSAVDDRGSSALRSDGDPLPPPPPYKAGPGLLKLSADGDPLPPPPYPPEWV
jgi:hypothetical protein